MPVKNRPIPSHVWMLPPLVVAAFVARWEDEDDASSGNSSEITADLLARLN